MVFLTWIRISIKCFSETGTAPFGDLPRIFRAYRVIDTIIILDSPPPSPWATTCMPLTGFSDFFVIKRNMSSCISK